MRADRRALFTSLAFHGALLAAGCAVILSPAVPVGNNAPGGEIASFVLDTGTDGAETEKAQEPTTVGEASAAWEHPKPELTAPSVETQEAIRPVVTTSALPGPSAVAVPSGALPASGTPKGSTAQKNRGEGRGKKGLASGGAGGGGSGGRFIPAKYDRCPPPPYPAAAQRKKVGGVVLLFVMVDEEGNPSAVQLRRTSGHTLLDEAALRAVRRWHFIPASAGGKPVIAKLEVPIRFVPS